MTGIELISTERGRQIENEGWTTEHDDAHDHGELADAAMCYVGAAMTPHPTYTHLPGPYSGGNVIPPEAWPWESAWWKPADRIRNLAKAGALIAAEIDRLQRLAASAFEPLCPSCQGTSGHHEPECPDR
jgi:hypothetical protein